MVGWNPARISPDEAGNESHPTVFSFRRKKIGELLYHAAKEPNLISQWNLWEVRSEIQRNRWNHWKMIMPIKKQLCLNLFQINGRWKHYDGKSKKLFNNEKLSRGTWQLASYSLLLRSVCEHQKRRSYIQNWGGGVLIEKFLIRQRIHHSKTYLGEYLD